MKDIEFRDKITSAMTYPIFIFIVFAFVLLGMLLGIVPRIGGVFRSLNIPLPLPTQILLGLSDFLVKNKLSVGMIVVLIFLFVIWLYKRHRNTLLSVIFRLPVVQGLVRDVDLTRFTRGLSLLLVSGIPISGALELTRDLVIKPEVRKAIEEGYQAVLQGKPLSQGLGKRGKLFPGILKKMIEVGERSGTLDKSLQEASEFLDYQTSKQVKTFTTLLEPIMLVFVAILVGGMMLAIVAPIYGLIGSINARR
jgi:type II secretory pathway component PulF